MEHNMFSALSRSFRTEKAIFLLLGTTISYIVILHLVPSYVVLEGSVIPSTKTISKCLIERSGSTDDNSFAVQNKSPRYSAQSSYSVLGLQGSTKSLHLRGVRVCFVTDEILGPDQSGGIANAVYRQAVLYQEQGARVSVLYCGFMDSRKVPLWKSSFEEEGIEFLLLSSKGVKSTYGTPAMKRAYEVLVFLLDLEDRKQHFDMFVLHDHGGVGMFILSAKRTGMAFSNSQMMVLAHSNSKHSNFFNLKVAEENLNSLVQYTMERRMVEQADMVLTPSAYYLNWMSRNGYDIDPTRTYVVSTLLPDVGMYSPVIGTQTVTSKKFAFFGRMNRQNGLYTFLAALDAIVKHGSMIPEKVLFLGKSVSLSHEGDVRTSHDLIRQRSKEWSIQVDIVENMSTKAALRKLKDGGYIVVNPSVGATAAVASLEALVYGVPLITSTAGALPEFFYDEDSFRRSSTPPASVPRLLEKMKSAMEVGIPLNSAKNSPAFIDRLYAGAAAFLLHNADRKRPEPTAVSVTVGIPTKDRPAELKECIESFLNVTIRPWFTVEILVVDAGSADSAETAAIVESYAQRLNERGIRIRFVAFNMPVHASIARNKIIEEVASTYILLFDDDDLAHPDMLLRMVTAAVRSNADVVTGFAQNVVINQDGTLVEKHMSLSMGGSPESTLLIHHSGKAAFLAKTAALIEVGGCTVDTDVDSTPFVDWDLYMKLIYAGKSVEVVPTAVYYYRMFSSNSIYYSMTSTSSRTHYGHVKRASTMCQSYQLPPTVCSSIVHAVLLSSLPKPDY